MTAPPALLLVAACVSPRGPAELERAASSMARPAVHPEGASSNVVAHGVSGAVPAEPVDPEFVHWIWDAGAAIQANFEPPRRARDVRCKVRVRVDVTTGEIRSCEITESSGIPAFDAAALRAVRRTRSFPIPPGRYRGILEQNGLSILLHAKQ